MVEGKKKEKKEKLCRVLYYGHRPGTIDYIHSFGVPKNTPIEQVRSWLCRRLGIQKKRIFMFEEKSGDMVHDKVKNDVFVAQFGDPERDIHYETRVTMGRQFNTRAPPPAPPRRFATKPHSTYERSNARSKPMYGFVD